MKKIIFLLIVSFVFLSSLQAQFIVQKSGEQRVIADTKSGLLWQDSPDNMYLLQTWAEANDYCAALVYGGMKGWRLPSNDELSTLATRGFYGHYNKQWLEWYYAHIRDKGKNEFFDDNFLYYASYGYWSSVSLNDESNKWHLYFKFGFLSKDSETNEYHVRCVKNSKQSYK